MRLKNYNVVLLKCKVNSNGNTNAGWIIYDTNKNVAIAKSKCVKYINYCYEEVKEVLEKLGYSGMFGYFDEEVKYNSEKAIKEKLNEIIICDGGPKNEK